MRRNAGPHLVAPAAANSAHRNKRRPTISCTHFGGGPRDAAWADAQDARSCKLLPGRRRLMHSTMHSVTDGYAKEQRLVLPCDAAKAENICVATSSRFDDLTSAPTLLKYYNVRATNSHHFAGSICQREHCVPPNPVEAPPPRVSESTTMQEGARLALHPGHAQKRCTQGRMHPFESVESQLASCIAPRCKRATVASMN